MVTRAHVVGALVALLALAVVLAVARGAMRAGWRWWSKRRGGWF